MNELGTVIPDDGLRVRGGPGTEHVILGVLNKGEQVTLLRREGDWWLVESRFGPGFVHADFVATAAAPDDGASGEATPSTYTCVAGDTLFGIARRFGLDAAEIARLNGLVDPFIIRVGQVLVLPSAATPVTVTTVGVLNPLEFAGETEVTSSSLQGHHRPWLGACSCDLDIRGAATAGTPVRFNLTAPALTQLRGVVAATNFACRSGILADGGRIVRLAIETLDPSGAWRDTGAWLLYAHLDPVLVAPGQVVAPGELLGRLGPAGGGEYNSSCARGSHVHVEATRARCVVSQGAVIRNDTLMVFDF